MSRGAAVTNLDSAGGTIRPAQDFVFISGDPWAVVGSPVDSHAPCPLVPACCVPAMAEGSSFIFIAGIPACLEGHAATCGHSATGRPWFRVHE